MHNGATMTTGGIYSLADCARLLREPRETVREWTLKGLAPTRDKSQRLSPSAYDFTDLVSLLVVARLRERQVPLKRIRTAEEYLRLECHVDRPLATTRLYTAGKDVLVHVFEQDGHVEHLVAASRYGQGAIDAAFDSVLKEVHYEDGIASFWAPWVDVQVNPRRQFRAPCVAGTGIQTATLYGFVKAGDDPTYVAEVYALPVERVLHAVEWEERLADRAPKRAA
jgi:uncharacterized protein (DUF433 family)